MQFVWLREEKERRTQVLTKIAKLCNFLRTLACDLSESLVYTFHLSNRDLFVSAADRSNGRHVSYGARRKIKLKILICWNRKIANISKIMLVKKTTKSASHSSYFIKKNWFFVSFWQLNIYWIFYFLRMRNVDLLTWFLSDY